MSVDMALSQAIDHFNAGRYSEADKLCTAIIQTVPNHVVAINILGVIAQKAHRHGLAVELFQRAIDHDNSNSLLFYNLGISLFHAGQRERAVDSLKAALAINPDDRQIIDYLNAVVNSSSEPQIDTSNFQAGWQEVLHKGIALHQAGDLEGAIHRYRQVLAVQPHNDVALSNFGAALQSQGRPEAAVAFFNKAISCKPDSPETYNNLANALTNLNRLPAAVDNYQKAISLQPDYAEAYNNLGNVLIKLNKYKEAIASYQKAIFLRPEFMLAHNNLGNALKDQDRLDEAIVSYQKAITLQPNHAEVYYNLGVAQKKQGELAAAVTSYQNAITIKADYAEAHSNLGNALVEQGKFAAAVNSYQKAIIVKPDYVEALNNLGNALKMQGKLAAAVTSFQHAITIKPDYAEVYCNLGGTLKEQGKLYEAISSYKKAIAIKPDLAEAHSNLLLCSQYIPDQTQENLLSLHQNSAESLFNRHVGADFCHNADLSSDRRLRIGLLSPDLRRHPVGFFLSGLLRGRPRSELEFICYSDTEPDDMTLQLQTYADGWRSIRSLGDGALVQQIVHDQIDILIDLAGHTAKNRLLTFAKRAAPIQMSWAGYVGTTGLASMDWLIADRHHVQQGEEQYYQEHIIRLPDSYVCYTPPAYLPDVIEESAVPVSGERMILANFGNAAKINQNMLAVWSSILKRCPEADLLLIYKGMGDPVNLQRITNYFQKAGVAGTRIIIEGVIPHQELLARYNTVALALDTQPYSGGLTTLEALVMGVPVVTTYGATFAGRHSSSYLHTVGLAELITNDLDAYEQLVVELVTNPQRLKKLRNGLQDRTLNSPVCDQEKFALDFAMMLRKVWQKWCNNQPNTAN